MNWVATYRLAFNAVVGAGMRTVLTAASLAVGIAAVVTIVGLSEGAQSDFQGALRQVGDNLMVITSERIGADALRGAGRRYRTLTWDDARAVESDVENIVRVAPIAMNNYTLSFRGEAISMTVIGTTPEFKSTNNQLLSSGRFITQMDVEDNARVAVIGSAVAQSLFGYEQPLGDRLLINGAPYIIVGVLREKGTDAGGVTQDDRVIIPLSTAQNRLLYDDLVDRIFVQYNTNQTFDQVVKEIGTLLRQRHGLLEWYQPDDFTIRGQSPIRETLAETEVWLERLLLGISGLSLSLSSAGLFAVTLISVKERESEIGLRLAVGAVPFQILIQFVSEAALTAVIGMVAGWLLGFVCLTLGQAYFEWDSILDFRAVLIPMAISLPLALISSFVPAVRAARLDPIIALRSA